MPTFAELAVAAHAVATTAKRDALILAARTTVTPVLTDSAGKVVYDPKLLKAEWVDVPNRIVVFSTPPDNPPTYLWVKDTVVKLARQDAGAWVTHKPDNTPYPELKKIEDVGAALTSS